MFLTNRILYNARTPSNQQAKTKADGTFTLLEKKIQLYMESSDVQGAALSPLHIEGRWEVRNCKPPTVGFVRVFGMSRRLSKLERSRDDKVTISGLLEKQSPNHLGYFLGASVVISINHHHHPSKWSGRTIGK